MAKYTLAQLDALRAARALGVTRVTVDGNTTEYRSLAEIDRIIADMEVDLGVIGARRTTAGFATFGRE